MSKNTPILFCLGANHKSAGFELREKLFLSGEEVAKALPHLKEHHGIKECIVLSTCNRLEIYGLLEEVPEYDAKLFDAFDALHRFGRHEEIEHRALRDTCYLHLGPEAVKHTFAVCAGLDSLVVGETQITGQFKDATLLARQQETLGQILGRLTQDALGTAKKIRSQTDIGKKTVSISHAAIDLANQVYGAVSEHKVAIVGVGEMGALAARYTVQYKPRRLFIVNRTLARAEALAKDLGAGTAYGIDHLESVLAQSDIILTSTSSEDPIILRDMVERVQEIRNHRPLLFVDISLPRNVAADVGKIEDVYVFDIDDLRQVVETHSEERRAAAEKAMDIVESNATSFMKWFASVDVKPVLSGFRSYLDELIARETARTLTRDMFKNLDSDQHEALRIMLGSIASKIASDAGTNVRQPPSGYAQHQLAEALAVLFPRSEKNQETGS